MGKDKKNKPSKNIFKVAGSRSFKAKNKAKSVTTSLKSLNEVTGKKKLAEVDKQLDSLQVEVRQQSTKLPAKQEVSRLVPVETLQQYEEANKASEEALEKLNDMSM